MQMTTRRLLPAARAIRSSRWRATQLGLLFISPWAIGFCLFYFDERVRREGFRWTRGDESRRSFESTPGKLRWFCGACGSQLMSEWVTADQVVLRVGSIDEGLDASPVAHIWTSHQAAWDQGEDALTRYPEGLPA